MTGPTTALLALAAALAAALPAAAQSARLQAAWDAAAAGDRLALDDDEAAALNQIAYHAAVDALCDGFEIDVSEIAAADGVLQAAAGSLDPHAAMARQADILVALGTAHGIFLAEGSLRPDAFCAEAAEVRADPEFNDHWR